ncbi:purine and uridine phosphorylase [Annulohypoxylon maeteangense]|uniref:purine and uridine phosphorylase n=1 Tax=Annulohypoxylon maeteangense TaxID=1927788 RepID=UPI002007F62B|nr:purine and uridine phosphorylase [Annulohypoxylon maeteangense]KAI0882065.1 purine and uridine phosphorylase [Annulohypoxylon maeteangense]
MRPRDRGDFKISIICALPLEAQAVDAIFDEEYEGFGKQARDMNAYTTGRIGKHNVVLAHMPGMGKSMASSAAASLRSSFIGIEIALVVGICGGVPCSPHREILLGDVIISDAIIQHDFGRQQYPDGFELKDSIKDSLGRPNKEIRALLSKLEIPRHLQKLGRETSQHLEILQRKLGGEFRYPGANQDILFESTYRHKHYRKLDKDQCEICDRCESKTDPICGTALESSCRDLGCEGNLVYRKRLSATDPQLVIHIGTVASGDKVMKSGEDRDEIAKKYRVIGFEMEGAGVWDNLPCIVIKGVCDYADSHKNKTWQYYAAITAASCTKAFLEEWAAVTQEYAEDVGRKGQQDMISLQNTRPTTMSHIGEKKHYHAAELRSLGSEMNYTFSQAQSLSDSNVLLTDTSMNSQVLIRLKKWWSNPNSELLWIQEQAKPSSQSSTSKGILDLARKANIPTAAWQYSRGIDLGNDGASCVILNQMLFSLIQQILQNLPSEFQSPADFNIERFRKLDGSRESIEISINLIQDLIQIGDQPLMVIIEGLQMIDRGKDPHAESGLRALLKLLQEPQNGLGTEGRPVKTLLITPGQTKLLISEVKIANRCEASHSRVDREGLRSSLFAKELLGYRQR